MGLIKKIIFRSAIIFIVIAIFSLTIGQILPIEIADDNNRHVFYVIVMIGLPIAVLLTLFGTIQKNNTPSKNWTWGCLTVLTSILSFFIVTSMMFKILGCWVTVTTIYKHKTNGKEIKEQWFDVGALGYRGKRIVEVKPFLKYWILISNIDTEKIDKNKWILVNEQGEIKFP